MTKITKRVKIPQTLIMHPLKYKTKNSPDLKLSKRAIITKNDAKRSRQHAGKRYREYAQRRACNLSLLPCLEVAYDA